MTGGALFKSSKLTLNTLQCTKKLAGRTFTTRLTEQQQSIQKLARDFADEHLKPNAAKLDTEGRFPFGPIKKLTDLGLMGATVDEEYGGLGLDYLSLAVAIEELSRGCASTGMITAIHNFLYANLVNEKGTPEQKERFLKDFTRGSIGCFALSEPGAGSDVASIKTRAVRDGDHWILNGRKSWVTSSVEGSAAAVFATFDPELKHKGIVYDMVLHYTNIYCDGDHWILNGRKSWVTSSVEGSAAAVFATFDPELKHKGIVYDMVLHYTNVYCDGDHWILNGRKSWVTSSVEGSAAAVFATFDPELNHKGIVCFLVPLDADGVFKGNKEPIMGVRAVTSCDLTLSEVRVPDSYVVGQPGIAQAALDTAISYAKEREAFGRSLTRLPSVKDRLSEMCILVETARLLTYRAATHVSTKNSAMAKYVAGRNANAVADHAVQILGGRGLSTNYAAERHYR
ncbi:acyl-CoA dehydrogenase, middle domain-containing protein [Phthorimaea operculella]|nr:acyl-CoA dehydrogenase, middle domain-containing protein [Phthorimaea operculella]